MYEKIDKIIDNISNKDDKKAIWDYIKEHRTANSKYKAEILIEKYKI
jgi:chromatin remodeling complex protein RSC6